MIQYTRTLNNNIYHSNKREPPPFFFILIPILGHVLVHFVDKTHVLLVKVELLWLLFLSRFFFNFVPTPNKSLRFTRFKRSYVNRTAVVLTNQRQSYTAFLLDVHCSKVLFCSCLSPMIVHLRNLYIFVECTCCSNVFNSKVGKQTKRCEIVIHKYIKTNTWS